MKTIDAGMDHKYIDSSTQHSGLYLIGNQKQKFEEYTIRNCYGVYLDGVNYCTFPLLDLRNVYSLNMRNSNRNVFKRVLIDDSWVGLKLNFLCSNNRFENVISSKAIDLDPTLKNPNGDGICIDKPDCLMNWFGVARCNDSRDTGIDQQGMGTVVEDFEAHGNLHGSKLWGSTIFNRYVATENIGNGYLAISGEHTLNNAYLAKNGGANIKHGLGGYREQSKKVTVSGFWDKATVDNPDPNSTLINKLIIGIPEPPKPVEDYENRYMALLTKFEASVAENGILKGKIANAQRDLA